MKLEAQRSKLKKSSQRQYSAARSPLLSRTGFGDLSLGFLLNFELWPLGF
jgi:hypothetical protein